MLIKELLVHLIDGGEVVQVGNENGGLDDIAHFQTCRLDNRFHVFQALTRLIGYVFSHFTGLWTHRDLT